jgi:peptidoglycan/LPS O-acetylase OafA/YrhL
VLLAVLDRPSVLSNAALRSFGKYSYGIHIFHQPLNLMIGVPILHSMFPRGAGLKAGFTYMAIVTAASYVLAMISYHGYEKHFLALKRHFQTGQRSSQEPRSIDSSPR